MRAIAYVVLSSALALLPAFASVAAEPAAPLKAGIIGLDTSHAIAFTELLNAAKPGEGLAGVKVVAAYPGGSADIPSSFQRVPQYTAKLRAMGVEIVPSIDELLKRVDVVLLESVDGRPHLAQARPVIAAGKPLFVDKPMAASLADAMEIFRLAKEKKVPCFSSSALRFIPDYQAAGRKDSRWGNIKRCTVWGPYHTEPHHPDLFWYGIHSVEAIYTIMGPGCKTVTRAAPDKAIGVWADGRTATFIAAEDYRAEIEGSKASGVTGDLKATGETEIYRPLVVQIVRFFQTGQPPVSAEETLEILAFMEAADESKRQGGAPVSVESVMKKAAGVKG